MHTYIHKYIHNVTEGERNLSVAALDGFLHSSSAYKFTYTHTVTARHEMAWYSMAWGWHGAARDGMAQDEMRLHVCSFVREVGHVEMR